MRVEANKMTLDYLPAKVEAGKTFENANPKTEEMPNKKSPIEGAELKRAINELNRFFSFYRLQFTVHEASGRYQVKMVDENTREVIREWPADTILAISARFKELLEEDLGILLDTRI
jgi:flagellar protein FlaG